MKNSFCAICIVLNILGFTGLVSGQVAVWSKDGPKIVFSSETDPPGAKRKVIANIQTNAEKNLFSRVFVDAERGVYFGYDLVVEPIAGTKQFRLTFKSLSVLPDKISLSGRTNVQNTKLTALALPKYPEPQVVQEGDTLAVDVLINSQTGVKIIDLIKVVANNDRQFPTLFGKSSSPTDASENSITAKDFTIADVELKITDLKLLANGQSVSVSNSRTGGGVTGAVIWFYLPQYGRFILSLTAHEGYGFQKTGAIQGNKISFSIDGNQYEWLSGSPIITSGNEKWNLWVLQDKDYKPEIEPTQEYPYVFGAADRVEYLLKKK